MRKISTSLILGFFLALVCLPRLQAQTATNSSADTNATAAQSVPTGQAPDDVTRKISDLVHAGKYAEAQQLTTGLLVAYPGDQRLIKAKALLERLLASPASAVPSSQPTNSVTPTQPVASGTSEQFTGMDKVKYNSLIELARQAQQNADLEQQKASLQRFMDESSPFLQKHPNEMLLWQLRAASALSLDDPYAPYAGYEAGQKLLAMGASDNNDPNLQHLLAQLNLKGWLDREKMEEAKKNTADSLVNGLNMKFARVPGTTVLFSVWNTRVQDFQAFVNDTHFDATQGMKSWIEYVPPKNLLNLFDNGVRAHFEQRGNSWQNPGWSQAPGDPVTGLSWDDAKAFCQWLTAKERHIGKIRPDQSYRLPTDAEWSMAVGLEAETGDTPKSKSGKVKTPISPLGNKVPNMYGIFDLGGKFPQFCEDWYDSKQKVKGCGAATRFRGPLRVAGLRPRSAQTNAASV